MASLIRLTVHPNRFENTRLVNGQQEVFNIDDDGCLNGGGVFGKFCKS